MQCCPVNNGEGDTGNYPGIIALTNTHWRGNCRESWDILILWPHYCQLCYLLFVGETSFSYIWLYILKMTQLHMLNKITWHWSTIKKCQEQCVFKHRYYAGTALIRIQMSLIHLEANRVPSSITQCVMLLVIKQNATDRCMIPFSYTN
jgi:hypothetical protein